MRRRDMFGTGAVGALAAAFGLRHKDIREEEWLALPCPGCGLPVAFFAHQRENRCAHCKTAVVRGLV